MSFCKNTSNLKTHLRSRHNIEVSVKKTNGDSAEVNHKPKSQNSLLRSITAKRHKEFDFAIEQYFAGTGKSPEILGNKYFFKANPNAKPKTIFKNVKLSNKFTLSQVRAKIQNLKKEGNSHRCAKFKLLPGV